MGAYVDEADYMAMTDGSQPYDGQRILQAEDEVNDLCFGRITAIGFEHLTEFQRRRVQKAVCLHAARIFEGVGAFYEDFHQLTDDETISSLNQRRRDGTGDVPPA